MEPHVEIRRTRSDAPWTYSLLDQRQRKLASESRDAILLSEVSPVVTVGRRTPGSDLLLDRAALSARGVDLYPVDRGGLATYHGPGQWVLFPVMSLERMTGDRRGVRKAVEGLLEAALGVVQEYEPRAEIRCGPETGVWSPRGKLGAVGVHIERGRLLHGLALNVFRTPESFVGIRPCGLEPRVDFLISENDPRREAVFQEVGRKLILLTFDRFLLAATPLSASSAKLDLTASQSYTRDSHSNVGA